MPIMLFPQGTLSLPMKLVHLRSPPRLPSTAQQDYLIGGSPYAVIAGKDLSEGEAYQPSLLSTACPLPPLSPPPPITGAATWL